MQMKYEILNRFTGNVQFTAEIECAADALPSVKLGLVVRVAVKERVDLRGAYLSGANLRDAYLSGADLRGADLSDADLSDANLSEADLRGAYLSGADLRGADLRGADLSGADLRGADLRGADLSGAYLSGANLSGVPKIANIHQSIYAAASKEGALNMGGWHACDTTHCRAGWVVTLAGEGGRALEWAMGTPAAAAIIYVASDPKLERLPDFYADNEAALADMKKMAEEEAAKAAVQS
jgi:uncharacterized protein YjbI with pentapeptide repeats